MNIRHGDDGMTLIELLLAAAISVMILGVVGAAFISAVNINQRSQEQLSESHDAQLVAAYLPGDLLSVGPGGVEDDPAAPTGCAASPAGNLNVARLTWTETAGGSTKTFAAAYRARQAGTEWQLVRHACQGTTTLPGTAADEQIVARNLQPVAGPGDLPGVVESGLLLTLRITDASGYTYEVSGTRRPLLVTPPLPPPPPPPPPPLPFVERLELVNTDAAGNVRIEVGFSATVPLACADDIDVDGLTGRGTAGPAVVSGSVVSFDILPGANPRNTAVDALTVAMNPEAGCAFEPLSATAPTDVAAPVLISLLAADVSGTARLFEDGDELRLTFTEPVANLPNPLTVQLRGGSGPAADQLAIPSVIQGTPSLGIANYVSNNKDANLVGSDATPDRIITAPLIRQPCTPGNCATLVQPIAAAPFTYTPDPALSDAAGNSLASVNLTPVATLAALFEVF